MKACILPLTLLCLAAPAAAQPALVETTDAVRIDGFTMTAENLEDLDVYDEEGNEIGEIEHVLGNDPQTPMAVAVEFVDEVADGDEDRIVPIGRIRQTDRGVELDSGVDIGSLEIWRD